MVAHTTYLIIATHLFLPRSEFFFVKSTNCAGRQGGCLYQMRVLLEESPNICDSWLAIAFALLLNVANRRTFCSWSCSCVIQIFVICDCRLQAKPCWLARCALLLIPSAYRHGQFDETKELHNYCQPRVIRLAKTASSTQECSNQMRWKRCSK